MEYDQNLDMHAVISDTICDCDFIDGIKIPIKLIEYIPTVLDIEVLSAQLEKSRLSEEIIAKKLKGDIDDIMNQLKFGNSKSFGIFKKNHLGKFILDANCSYTGDDNEGYLSKMLIINDHFDYLKGEEYNFPSAQYPVIEKSGNVSLEESIRYLFTIVGSASVSIFSQVGQSLKLCVGRKTIESLFSRVLSDFGLSKDNYVNNNDRIIAVVCNYDNEKEECDGIGIIHCKWSLKIDDYNKGYRVYPYKLDVSVNAFMYKDVALLDKHYNKVKDR